MGSQVTKERWLSLVESACLENRSPKRTVGSNPTRSASKPVMRAFFGPLFWERVWHTYSTGQDQEFTMIQEATGGT